MQTIPDPFSLPYDLETGLVYNRARYLDTSMGRFTIRDPIGGGSNLYGYGDSSPAASTVLSEQHDRALRCYKDVVLDAWVWQEAKDEVVRDYKLTGDLQARWNEKVTWRSTVGDLVTSVYRKKVEWYDVRKWTCVAGTMEEYTLLKAAFREKNAQKMRADTRSPAMRENCQKLGQLMMDGNGERQDAMVLRTLINNEGSLWGALWDTSRVVGPDLLAALGSRPSSGGSVTMAHKRRAAPRTGEAYSIRINPAFPGRPDPRFSIDTSGFVGEPTGANGLGGGIRNAAEFWRKWAELRPETLSPANRWRVQQLQANSRGPSPRIDPTWLKSFPEHAGHKGAIVHHHVEQGPIAVPVPMDTHRGFGNIWHER